MSIESTTVILEIEVEVHGERIREPLDTTPRSFEEIVDHRTVARYKFNGKTYENGNKGCVELVADIDEAATNQADF